jgi:two-component system sensor histidine kinase YesM
MPSESVSVNAGIILKATFTIEGVCLLLVMILIWALSYSFVKRIQQLNRTMRMAAIGNLEIEVRSDSKDEIGELTNRFGKMLKSFKAMIDEVYRSKIIQQEAEMKALQSQINPHFLYNSLSLINWKAIEIHADEISRITTTLSLFYRTTLNRGDDIIPVQGELDNTRAYIDIQLVMHEYGFDVAYDIEESLYAYDVIKLILQPVVENAIEHGIDQKRGGRGLLTIRGAEEGETIVFTVEDNGPGMTGQQLEEVFVKKTHGYGLFNVQQRIQIFFGTQYGISAHSEPEQGTRITIVLPKYNKNKG